jgi:hypothetical protein
MGLPEIVILLVMVAVVVFAVRWIVATLAKGRSDRP